MDSSTKFWLGIWSLVTAAFVTLVVSITLGNQLTNEKIASMVAGGADPIAASCAIVGIEGGGGRELICMEAARHGR